MAITGLTTNVQGSLVRLGYIKKGTPRKQIEKDGRTIEIQGDDLDHFRLDTKIPKVQAAWDELYKSVDGKPKEIEGFLLQDEVDTAFPCWLEQYNSSGMMLRCDGEQIVKWFNTSTGKWSFEPKPCPGMETCLASKSGCSRIGRLNIIVQGLGEMGYLELQTHAKHDLGNLTRELQGVRDLAGRLTGIPFIVTRALQPCTISYNGKRSKGEKSLLHIRIHPKVASQVLTAATNQAMKQFGGQSFDNEPLLLNAVPDIMDNTLFTQQIAELREKSGLSKEQLIEYLQKQFDVTHPVRLTEPQRKRLLAALDA